MFYTSQIKWLPNYQYLCSNLVLSLNENAFVLHSVFVVEKIVVYFIIIKLKAELCSRLSNIGSIVTSFASQKLKNFFRVTVRVTNLDFRYFPTCFCCKSVSCNCMIACFIIFHTLIYYILTNYISH